MTHYRISKEYNGSCVVLDKFSFFSSHINRNGYCLVPFVKKKQNQQYYNLEHLNQTP